MTNNVEDKKARKKAWQKCRDNTSGAIDFQSFKRGWNMAANYFRALRKPKLQPNGFTRFEDKDFECIVDEFTNLSILDKNESVAIVVNVSNSIDAVLDSVVHVKNKRDLMQEAKLAKEVKE